MKNFKAHILIVDDDGIVAINNQRLSAKKEAACGPVKSERATSALAEKVKTPNPKRANGIEASHAKD